MNSLTKAICAALLIGAAPAVSADLDTADVVLLGEVHDNPEHHRLQADAIRALSPSAVVFEMLAPDQAAAITPEMLSDEAALDAATGWSDSGWPSLSVYMPIFEALGDAAIYGAALPRAEVRQAFSDGAAGVFGPDAGLYGLSTPLPDAEQRTREQLQDDAHCNAMPPDMLGGLVEAQRLRDAAFARTTLQALRDTGGPVVVITGHGHVRKDWGMPAKIASAAPEVSVFAKAFVEAPSPDATLFDEVIVTSGVEREDPCAAFR